MRQASLSRATKQLMPTPRGAVGGGSGLGKKGGGVSWVRWASTGVQATTSTVSPLMRQTRPRCVTVHRRGSSGEVMPRGAGRVLFHVGAAATVVPVPLATGSWGTVLSGCPLIGSPIMIEGGRGGEGCNRDRESREECPGGGSVWTRAEASQGASPSPSPQDFPPPAEGCTQEGEVHVRPSVSSSVHPSRPRRHLARSRDLNLTL